MSEPTPPRTDAPAQLLRELREERNRLLAQVERHQQSEHEFSRELQEPRDEVDASTAQRDIDRDQALADFAARRLHEVEAALERAEHGQLGRCQRCGLDIEPERQHSLIGTRFCAACARKSEAEARRSR